LAGINRHLDGVDQDPHFGFLLGHVCRCPTTKVCYSVADTWIAAQEVLAEEASGAFLIRAWAEARSAFADHFGVLLGWYHSHHLLGLMLSESDEAVNERFFGQPWQAAIVAVPNSNGPLGGVFRLYPDAGVAERRRPSEFYELHDKPVDSTSGEVATAVIWTNYEIGREEPSDEPQAPHSVVEPALDEPASDEPYLPPLVIPGEGPELDLQPANRRRKLVPLVVFVLVMMTVAAVTVMRGLDRTPVTVLPQVQTVRTLDQRRLFGSIDGLTIAVERYDERAIDFDAGRISCDLLATGYAAADASFVETATYFVALGGETGREAQDAYETASAEISIVNNHFDGSGCPRP
jgi:proteasome lid subunit RPN8/RPN11